MPNGTTNIYQKNSGYFYFIKYYFIIVTICLITRWLSQDLHLDVNNDQLLILSLINMQNL
jgi:hypothetical protein